MIKEGSTLFVDGFNECICGFTDDGRVIYYKTKMIETLIHKNKLTFEDALEHCEMNLWGAHIGEYSPIYVNDFDADFEELNEYINA